MIVNTILKIEKPNFKKLKNIILKIKITKKYIIKYIISHIKIKLENNKNNTVSNINTNDVKRTPWGPTGKGTFGSALTQAFIFYFGY